MFSDYTNDMAQREPTRRRYRFAAATVVALVAVSLIAPAASAKPAEDKLDKAHSAVAIGLEKAKGLANEHAAEAPGQEHRAQGLARAKAAVTAAAERKAARDEAKGERDKPGRGLGRGHADDVHTILARGGSPSDLPSHSDSVHKLAAAYEKVKADHPGQGNGPTEKADDESQDSDSDAIDASDADSDGSDHDDDDDDASDHDDHDDDHDHDGDHDGDDHDD